MSPSVGLLTIGDELLNGSLVDTNSSVIADRLAQIGLAVQEVRTLPDSAPAIVAGIRKMADSLKESIDNLPDLKTRILLENTASVGSSLGHRFEYIAEIMERSGVGEKLYLCFDTCHAYVSGYDIATARGLDLTLSDLDRLIGLERLRVVHFNDTKFGLGSRRDRRGRIDGRGRAPRRSKGVPIA